MSDSKEVVWVTFFMHSGNKIQFLAKNVTYSVNANGNLAKINWSHCTEEGHLSHQLKAIDLTRVEGFCITEFKGDLKNETV